MLDAVSQASTWNAPSVYPHCEGDHDDEER